MSKNVYSIPEAGKGAALSPRDARVVELVGRFRLLAAEQIRSLVFADHASKTPMNRCMKRLTDAGYLARLGRVVGGFGGGSGRYVYQLGRVGWRHLGKGGAHRPLRVIDYHTLTIAECFVMLKTLERSAELTVVSFAADPVSRRTVGTTLLTPDAFVELGVRAIRRKFALWLEIDRGTENAATIRDKCVRYWRTYQAWDPAEVFPYIVFVAPDVARRRELERVIAGGPQEAQGLFRVCELSNFISLILESMQ